MAIVTKPLTAAQRVAAGPEFYNELDMDYGSVSFADRFGAGFMTENSVASFIEDLQYRSDEEEVKGYDQYAEIPEDLEAMPLSLWDGVKSPADMQQRIEKVRVEQKRQQILSEGGWGGFWGQFFGAMGSPEFWPLLVAAPQVAGGTVTMSAARLGLMTGAEELIHEGIMHQSQMLRTKEQSMINMGFATVLGGGIGAGIGKLTQRRLQQEVFEDLEETATNNGLKSVERSVNAAATLSKNDEMIVNKPWLRTYMLGPMRPLAHSRFANTLNFLNRAWEHGWTTGKNLKGKANAPSFESKVEREMAQYYSASSIALNGGYKSYLKELGRSKMAGMNPVRGKDWVKFQEEVHRALVNGDTHVSKAVAATAKKLRSEVYDPVLKAAKEAGLIDEGMDIVKFAQSYAPRRWNKKAVRENFKDFTDSLEQMYVRDAQRMDFEKAKTAKLEVAEKARAKIAETEKNYRKKIKRLKEEVTKLEQHRETLKTKAAKMERTKQIAAKKRLIRDAENAIYSKKGKGVKLAKLKQVALKAELEVKRLSPDSFKIVDKERLTEIQGKVIDTYNRIAFSHDLDVYMPPGRTGTGSAFKERMVPLEDNFLLDKGWINSDLEAMTMNHINTVLKPSRATIEFGETEMLAMLKNIEDEAAALAAANPNQAAKIMKEATDEIAAFNSIRDRWYGRNTVASSRGEEAVNNFLRAIRNLNTSLMMGMVTLTSLGDVARWNLATVYAKELGKAGPGLAKAMKAMKLNRKEWQKIGIAHEMATQIRTAKIMDSAGTIDTDNPIVHATGKLAQGLMRATQLARWTDYGKLMVAAYTQNDLIQKAMGYAKLGQRAKTELARMGVDENLANSIRREVERGLTLPEDQAGILRIGMKDAGYDGAATQVRFDLWENQSAAETFKEILFIASERAIVSPRAGDVPQILGGRGEFEKSLLQFLSFSFAAVNQIGVPIGRRLRMGDPKAYGLLGQMMAGGALAIAVRMAAQGRMEELEDWKGQDWALNAADLSGAVPLFMMGFNTVNVMTDNALTDLMGAETMARFKYRNPASWLGPTVGTMDRAIKVGAGMLDGEVSASDIRQASRLVPYNNYMLLTYPYRQAVEGIAEEFE